MTDSAPILISVHTPVTKQGGRLIGQSLNLSEFDPPQDADDEGHPMGKHF